MAWSLNIPVVGVSSLSAIARSVKYFDGLIVPIIDARRGQVFTGIYTNGNIGHSISWENVEADRIVLMSDWLQLIEQKYEHEIKRNNLSIIFTGNDVNLYRELIEERFGFEGPAVINEFSSQASRAGELIELGIQLFKSGTNHDAKSLAPEYLRLAEAEYNWLKENSLKSKNI
jgi:tRNA threonylcarbamoyladenosine biosynthesis protein TsaB